MNIINHQDNGAKGLRIAASVCITVWGIMYFITCVLRTVVTRTEAAQLYIDSNMQEEKQYDE